LSSAGAQPAGEVVRAVCRPLAEQIGALIRHRDPVIREHAVSVYAKLAPADSEAQLAERCAM